ncbi:MAG: hypothetical protein HZB38_15165 [Planctomycetes bacterium]|nr:hypothetical protein [Planctomycetota bacterium]
MKRNWILALAALLGAVSETAGQDRENCLYCHQSAGLSRFDEKSGTVRLFYIDPDFTHSKHGPHARLRCTACHLPEQVGVVPHLELTPVDCTRECHLVFPNQPERRLQSARPPLEQAQVCAVCHSDPKVMQDHELPNTVGSFVRSFHGKAALLGDNSAADCVACHVLMGENAHLMLGPQSQHSAVNSANIADNCRNPSCHPGADPRFSAAAVHFDLSTTAGPLEYGLAVAFIIITVISFGPSASIVILELLHLFLGRHSHHAERAEAQAEEIMRSPRGRSLLTRFSVWQRVQHWILALLFAALCVTGFPMKFADDGWARVVIDWFGGLSAARIVHHWAGISLIVGFAIHLAPVGLRVLKQARRTGPDGRRLGVLGAYFALPLGITPQDAGKMGQLMAYLVGLRSERPTFGKFTVTEKFEYFGVVWGTTLLGLTGLMLWGEQIASHWLGGRVFNLGLIIHTYEAFLAVIHVGILHIYNVIFNPTVFPFSPATLSGRTPTAKLAEENPEYVYDAARKLGLASNEVTHG